ncbi:GNAT family N-acetyltransferase [Salibacterium salarium]|uniref:GNAT family N-acetyltransferase n=1 Tax=Salibacterium salarium TaxID=284579 RepID=A0A3R9Q3Z9_9BACI|nr:GNAT family N-acetyltransferase [Salibacterium salarium]RSL33142.1 GNAT family N-acetyltransferase [Salibacterium salarium]
MPIRQANKKDISAIAQLHVEGWQRTYKNIFPAEVLDNLNVEERADQWEAILSASNTVTEVVTSDKGGILGVVSGGPLQDSSIHGYDGELYAIYLAPDIQGQGLGKRLFISMAQHLYKNGFQRMMVWLAYKNSARYFYERFSPVEVSRKINQFGVEDVAYGYQLSDLLSNTGEDKSSTLGKRL